VEEVMNGLVQLIVEKTGISQIMAMTVVNIVVDYLNKSLPAPLGNQIVAALNHDTRFSRNEN
jgi:hypothetical protein